MQNKNGAILVTGGAGFIGFHLSLRLAGDGFRVIALDNINDYYDIRLKYGRLAELGIGREDIQEDRETASSKYPNLSFYKTDLTRGEALADIFSRHEIKYVVNLAAQAGVRYSLTNPQAYIDSNINGFLNILEACRHNKVEHLVYASSSSVYGLNTEMPFSVNHNVDHPVSLYAASKKSNELMAHSYSHLFGLPVSGLRFFTVYGPWGRPDMALFLFVDAIMKAKPIEVFNEGKMERDFTYVDDIVEGIFRLIHKPAESNPRWKGGDPDPATSPAPYRLYNIGNTSPVKLLDFIEVIEKELGKKAERILRPIQPGDVPATWADVSSLEEAVGYRPGTDIEHGVRNFVKWYLDYYCP